MKKILIIEDESLVAHHIKLILNGAGYKVCGIADSVEEARSIISEQVPDLVLLDIHLKGTLNGIDMARELTVRGISFVYLTANFQGKLLEEAKSTLPYGFIVKPFREDDLLTTLEVALFRAQNIRESLWQYERELDEKLKSIKSDSAPLAHQLYAAAVEMQRYVPFDYLNVIIQEEEEKTETIGFLRIGFEEYQLQEKAVFSRISQISTQVVEQYVSRFIALECSGFFNEQDFQNKLTADPLSSIMAKLYSVRSALYTSFYSGSRKITFSYYSRKADCYKQQHLMLLDRLQTSFSVFFGALSLSPEKDCSIAKRIKPQETGLEKHQPGAVIAASAAMLSVMDLVSTVAPLNTSVLILGESGTGKERVARAIHTMSTRRDKPMVIVNCASLPANLVESELFGHEKGAFTGATERRIGKFEQADCGTIFLDEIGEMSADLQVKLLRVLQEQEIERIGGKGPFKIDVRIIAATNRNLETEMEEGRFRLDLYYRLYVFPIIIPPLRERPEDIVILSRHFIEHLCQKYNRSTLDFTDEVFEEMLGYRWPGNVRELEHFIERTVLLAKENPVQFISLPKPRTRNTTEGLDIQSVTKTMSENERDYIMAVLKKCNGRIRGADGAAAVMGLPPTTLHSRMKKLGIKYLSS